MNLEKSLFVISQTHRKFKTGISGSVANLGWPGIDYSFRLLPFTSGTLHFTDRVVKNSPVVWVSSSDSDSDEESTVACCSCSCCCSPIDVPPKIASTFAFKSFQSFHSEPYRLKNTGNEPYTNMYSLRPFYPALKTVPSTRDMSDLNSSSEIVSKETMILFSFQKSI